MVLPPDAPSIWRSYYPVNPDKRKEGPKEHIGIDIIAPAGTPVIAPADGTVVAAYFEPMYGNHLVLEHGRDEDGRLIQTRFLHLEERHVKEGDALLRGQQIGTMGMTGLLGVGFVHLHYELAREGPDGRITHVNPHLYWMNGPGRVTCFDEAAHWPNQPFRTTYPVPCGSP